MKKLFQKNKKGESEDSSFVCLNYSIVIDCKYVLDVASITINVGAVTLITVVTLSPKDVSVFGPIAVPLIDIPPLYDTTVTFEPAGATNNTNE